MRSFLPGIIQAFLCVALTVVLLVTASGHGANVTVLSGPDIVAAFHAARPSQALVFAGDKYSTATIFETDAEEVRLIFNRHLCEDAHLSTGDRVTVMFVTGEEADAAIIFLSERADLAMAHVRADDISADTRNTIRAVTTDTEAYEALLPDAQLFVVRSVWPGSSDGPDARVQVAVTSHTGYLIEKEVILSSFSHPVLIAKIAPERGMSGSGLFDDRAAFLGLMSAGNGEGVALFVPLPVILEEISKNL
ncbi:MAG: hypothetical protein IJQ12_08560 [Lachnospiraceae bacterium]|nr:hypothetical protein [Lachnospiraceae bacterium]